MGAWVKNVVFCGVFADHLRDRSASIWESLRPQPNLRRSRVVDQSTAAHDVGPVLTEISGRPFWQVSWDFDERNYWRWPAWVDWLISICSSSGLGCSSVITRDVVLGLLRSRMITITSLSSAASFC